MGTTSNLLLSHFCQVLRVGCRSAEVDNDVGYSSARLDVVDFKMAVILNVDERHDKTTPIFTSSSSPVFEPGFVQVSTFSVEYFSVGV